VRGQPTLLLVSSNGVDWTLPAGPNKKRRHNTNNGTSPFLLASLFYLTVPVYHPDDGYYYALAKTQENSVGSLQLCRTKSLYGPWMEGPILARGIRHCDMHLVTPQLPNRGGTLMRRPHLFVFFTHIGDVPEKVMVGTIDLSDSDWMQWTLLPGPTIVSPDYPYEHGNATLQPSKCCSANCVVMNQLRDPHFLPDDGDDIHKHGTHILSGILFYVVQGERSFAAARLALDMNQYFHRYRRPNMDRNALRSSHQPK
jgi:hypothetical protein